MRIFLCVLFLASPAFAAIIGQINTRDNTLIVKSAPTGMVYSVQSKDGAFLAQDIDESQLKIEFPQLHDFVKSGVALDASVRREYLKPLDPAR